MKALLITLFFLQMPFYFGFSDDIELVSDNGKVRTSGYPASSIPWEESKIIKPNGPCYVKKIRIYFYGSAPQRDTIFIVGDPSEGVVPPTLWVESYNRRNSPITFDFTTSGWYEFPIDNLILDGLDRIVIQHRVKFNGPWFAIDDDGLSKPYSSFLMNPIEINSLGGPGQYYLSSGDFLVRIIVEYMFPEEDHSLPPPPPQLIDVTEQVGLFVNGKPIKATDVSVVDFNSDDFDDIVVGNYFFVNKKDGTFQNVTDSLNIHAGMTSWGDFDNDGFIDCYALINGEYNEDFKMVVSKNSIYRNNGNGSFTKVPTQEIFALPYPNPSVDFKVSTQFAQDSIHNPYNCITPLWTDLNNDGRLDLYLANNRVGLTLSGQYVERYFPDQVWIQGEDGKFYNVTDLSGMPYIEPFSSSFSALGYYDCYGANACDYNQDGKIDIFVANYRLAPDFLLKNNGDDTFTNVSALTGVQGIPTLAPNYFGHGMGAEWGDLNNDCLPDLVVGNLGHPDWRGLYSNPSLIFINDGAPNYTFTEKHQKMGLKFFEMNAGVTLGDFNLDGNLDLWHGQISYYPIGTNNEQMRSGRLYFNQGEPNFKLRDVTWEMGTTIHGAWSGARIDFDGDGDLDLILASNFDGVRLFRNDISQDGNYVGFFLVGSPLDKINMDCYGTRVFLYSGGKRFYRELMGSIAGTRSTQSSHLIHFGLGGLSSIDSVVFVYPNGKIVKFDTIGINQYYKVFYNYNSKGPYLAFLNNQIRIPRQIYPSNFQINLSNNLMLHWEKVFGSNLYRIEISDEPTFQNYQEFITSADTILVQGLKKGSRYWWRVGAISQLENVASSGWSSVWSFVVGNPIPKKVNLLSPKDTSKAVALCPIFIWNSSSFDNKYYNANIYYVVEISSDLDFATMIFRSNPLKDTVLVLTDSLLNVNQTYYWRVKAINEDGVGEYSNVFGFSTDIPKQVDLISPPKGDPNVPLKPTYRWSPTNYAIDYQIEVSKDSVFESIIFTRIVTSTSIFQIQPLETDTKYFWHVRGRSEAGFGVWSEVNWFKTINQTNDVTEYVQNELCIFPNPFEESLSFKFELQCPKKIQIYNIYGEKVYETFCGERFYQLETSNFPNGVYLVKIYQNGKIYISRAVKTD